MVTGESPDTRKVFIGQKGPGDVEPCDPLMKHTDCVWRCPPHETRRGPGIVLGPVFCRKALDSYHLSFIVSS